MKTVGLITEYNPFHNGHQYHIKKAKEITGADRVIIVMSGDFVQRGQPAIMPKHIRAKMALECGASAVFELPVRYATGSAESFAMGAVKLLDHLGIVDYICFGSECGDLDIMQKIADILESEPEEYVQILRKELQKGNSYPTARSNALEQYTNNPAITAIINQPNNILGIEYLKALKTIASPIIPFTLTREGAGYHDTIFHEEFSSASAIRNHLKENTDHHISDLSALCKQIPASCMDIFQEEYLHSFPVYTDTFSFVLKYALLCENHFNQYLDVSEELSNRILRERNQYQNFDQFCECLKTKELTYSRISRALIHIMLHITTCDTEHEKNPIYYARLLGFRADENDVLSEIKAKASIPMITKLANTHFPEKAVQDMLSSDCLASDLYQSAISELYHTPYRNEYQKQIIRI